jgi:2-phosphosulfolactate phosphatase
MFIETLLTSGPVDREMFSGKSAAVIDILRSSVSLITALANGAGPIHLFETPDQAREKAESIGRESALLCGERNGRKVDGFDLGNSPAEYTRGAVEGRTLLFTSTNGSRMTLMASGSARRVVIAGFANVSSAAHALARGGGDCVLACSGKEGRFSLEDAVCAGMLAERIRSGAARCRLSDETRAAVLLYGHFKDDLEGLLDSCEHGVYLKSIGMQRDLPLCAKIDETDIVPVYQNGVLGL